MDNPYQYQVQADAGGLGIFLAIYAVLVLAVYVVWAVGLWKMYAKAGRPGWAAIVPVYNWWVWVEIIERPRWWFWVLAAYVVGALLSSVVPLLGIVVFLAGIAVFVLYLIGCLDMAKRFGQGSGYGIGLWLLPFIFAPILGFGSSRYQGDGPGPIEGDALWATAMGNTDAPPSPTSPAPPAVSSAVSPAPSAPGETPRAPAQAGTASPAPYTLAAPRAPVAPLGSWPPAPSK